jgi:hypothetical protein
MLVGVTFRDRLIATIRAARPVLATLVVSQDLDVGVPFDAEAGASR